MKRARPKNAKIEKRTEFNANRFSYEDYTYDEETADNVTGAENDNSATGAENPTTNESQEKNHDIVENKEDGTPADKPLKATENSRTVKEADAHDDEPKKQKDNAPVNKDTAMKQDNNQKKTKKKKKSPFKRFITAVAVIIVLFFAAMGLGLFDGTDLLYPIEGGKVNVLLLGVDEDGLRTDAIMVASYDMKAGEVNMLSVPRDTKVYIENRKMTRKINAVHAMSSEKKKGEILGAEATAEAVTALTGLPINYYVEFSFLAIDTLFDILGPVEFDVPDVEGKGRGMNYDDPYQNLHIALKPGPQKLSGNQIQQFLRYRKSKYKVGSGSDIDRVARQQELVKAIVDQKVNATILIKIPSIFTQISKLMVTNISVGDITKYVRYVNKLSSESIHTYSLPGEAKTIGGAAYFVCDTEKTAQLMSEVFGSENPCTDRFTISGNYSQKALKAGNMTKKNKNTPEATEKVSVTKSPAKEPVLKEPKSNEKEPTKAPVVTKEPTKAPVVTKSPSKTPEATKTPLEDIDDDVEVID